MSNSPKLPASVAEQFSNSRMNMIYSHFIKLQLYSAHDHRVPLIHQQVNSNIFYKYIAIIVQHVQSN